MAPRLNKRQQRELEELELSQAQAAAAQEEATDEEEEEEERESAASVFAALNTKDEPEDEVEEEEEDVATPTTTPSGTGSKSKKKNKKKKKAAASAPTITDSSSSSPATPSKPSKEMDEIDLALASLGLPIPSSSSSTSSSHPSSTSATPSLSSLLTILPSNLNSSSELRRFFGSKVIGSTQTTATNQGGAHARLSNNKHHKASGAGKRGSILCPEPEGAWGGGEKGVLGLERYDGVESVRGGGGEAGKVEWWTFRHGKEYKEAQLMFLEVLQQMDGNRLFEVLQKERWHVDTLMQLGEMNNQQGDQGAASAFLSRALHTLSSPSPSLPPSFLTGNFRLPYSQIENRAFFIGVERRVRELVKRGTWRTGLEWCKLGLAVGGEEDPLGLICAIDFLGPKAGQFQWFLDFVKVMNETYPSMLLPCYPGLAYAKALCYRGLETESGDEEKPETERESTKALKTAFLTFPMVATLLYTSLGGRSPIELVKCGRAGLDGSYSKEASYMISLLSTFYVARSEPLWKDPTTLSWFWKTCESAAKDLGDGSNPAVVEGERLYKAGGWPKGLAPEGVIRAAFVSDIPSIRPYLPPSTLSTTSYSFDPIPPSAPHSTSYNDTYFSTLYTSSSSSSGTPRPNPRAQAAQRRQLEGMRNQLAQLLGIGNQGGAVELTDELREELMREFEQMGVAMRGGREGVPGGFPGTEQEGGDDSDDDDEAEEGDAAAQAGLLQRFAGMFRGQLGAAG